MRILATSALVCCAATALLTSSTRADFVLNCHLLDTTNPIWKQHCKAETYEQVRVRCRDRLECLVLKKMILSGRISIEHPAAVVATRAPSVTNTLGSIVVGEGDTLGGTVEGAGGTLGGAVGGISPSGGEAASSMGSNLGSATSGATNAIGNAVAGAGDTVGSTLSK